MKAETSLQKFANPVADERELARLCSSPTYQTLTLNPAAVYLESLGSDVSRRVIKSSLNSVARHINPASVVRDAWQMVRWDKLTAPSVRLLLAKTKGSPATRNKMLSALKGVTRMAWEMRLLDTDELERIRAIKGDSGTRELSGRCIPEGEISALLNACGRDPSAAGARDGAMISLAAVTGARRAEIAGLDAGRMKIEEDDTITLKVIGKRNRERTLFVRGNAYRALKDWLKVRGGDEGAIFCMIGKGGRIDTSHFVSPVALDKTLGKRSREAGIEKVKWHDFRRTTASSFLDAGADIATVAKIMGHANVQTTARYDRRGERAQKKAAGLLSVPYFKRYAN
ncbi:MAG: tyrosine-type recombinase/integrase [Verrucomicrobiota bacterium]